MAAATTRPGGEVDLTVLVLHRGSTSGRLVRGYLEVEGYTVTETASVADAVGKLSAVDGTVLVVDVGVQWPPAPAYRQLLLAAGRRNTPVIALVPHGATAALPGQERLTQLVKPFTLADIGERVAAARNGTTLRGRQVRPAVAPAFTGAPSLPE